MRAHEISVGGHYIARVSGRLVTVQVIGVHEVFTRMPNGRMAYDVVNTDTGRKLVFASAAKFRYAVPARKTVTP